MFIMKEKCERRNDMSDFNMCEEAEAVEVSGSGSAVDGSQGYLPTRIEDEAIDVMREAKQFMESTHVVSLYDVYFQLNHLLERLSCAMEQLKPYTRWSDPTECPKDAIELYQKLEGVRQELQEYKKDLSRKICEEDLNKGRSLINKVKDFLDKDPAEEKRKDKRAYYDTCDNYSRLCEGLAADLSEHYESFADEENSSSEYQEMILTLRNYKNVLDSRIR